MAVKNRDLELLQDARSENKSFVLKTEKEKETAKPEFKQEQKTETTSTPEENINTEPEQQEQPQPDPLAEKWAEFSKGMNGMSGPAIVEIVDDLKSKLLLIYAKKQGVDIPEAALKMDVKAKEMAAFLVDFAVKDKLLEFLRKNPLIGAGGVLAISAASSFLMINMMSKQKKETDELKAKLSEYERQAQQNKTENASFEIIPQ